MENKIDSNLSDLISIAESSVQKIQDQQLKQIAFSKTLDYLLASRSEEPKIRQTNAKNVTARKKNTTPSKGSGKKDGPSSWIMELIEEGFFKEPKSSSNILGELTNRSHRLKPSDITLPLQKLCHDKLLRRKQQKLKDSSKLVFHWYNW